VTIVSSFLNNTPLQRLLSSSRDDQGKLNTNFDADVEKLFGTPTQKE